MYIVHIITVIRVHIIKKQYICWIKPPYGWIKLNSDVACKGNCDVWVCGELFRN